MSSSEKTNISPSMELTAKTGMGLTLQGRHSCQVCRYVDYNGETCGLAVSPLYGKKVGVNDWCRYWAPAMGRNVSLKK